MCTRGKALGQGGTGCRAWERAGRVVLPAGLLPAARCWALTPSSPQAAAMFASSSPCDPLIPVSLAASSYPPGSQGEAASSSQAPDTTQVAAGRPPGGRWCPERKVGNPYQSPRVTPGDSQTTTIRGTELKFQEGPKQEAGRTFAFPSAVQQDSLWGINDGSQGVRETLCQLWAEDSFEVKRRQ